MNKYLIIIGAGGHGRVSFEIAKSMNKWEKIFISDDNPNEDLENSDHFIGTTKILTRYIHSHDFFVAIGSNEVREKITSKIIEEKGHIVNLIHPTCVEIGNNTMGTGNIFMPNSVISSNVSIGNGCIINTNAIIEHDSSIGNFVHLSPNATLSGNVNLGNRSWIGAGATVINNININSDVIVGAGSVVVKNIDYPGIVVGVPAKVLSK